MPKKKKLFKKGISVIEQDIDSGLENFGNQSFDYVVMSQSIQALKKPEVALEEIVRIGKECIVSIPNFANIKCRLQLFLRDKCRFQCFASRLVLNTKFTSLLFGGF